MIFDLLFPKFCIGCRKFGRYICHDCQKFIIPFRNNFCSVCNRPSDMGLNHQWCSNDLDGVISFFQYKNILKKTIKSLKYNLVYSVWDEIINLIPNEIVNNLRDFKKKHGIVYLQKIPLHNLRLKQRGYNQIEPLEDYLSELLKYKKIDVLKRERNTQPQALMKNKLERIKNIADAFIVKKPLTNNEIIVLVDDVYTTGSTCKEAAKTLKQNGARKVFAITLARD